MNVARYSPDGRYVAGVIDQSPLLKLYRVDANTLKTEELATGNFHIHPINDIAWSPCSNFIATGGEDCVIVVWRIHHNERTGKTQLEPRRVLRGHVAAVTTLAFNYKGTMLASGSVDEKVIVWNVKGGILFKLLNAHSKPIVSVDFSYDSKLLLSASHDGYVRVWSLVDGMALRILSGAEELMPICAAIFSPNSAYALVTYTDGVTRLLNLTSKEVVKQYGVSDRSTQEQSESKQTQMPTPPEQHSTDEQHPAHEQHPGSNNPNLYSRELAFCRPNYILVGKPTGVAAYDINSQKHVKTFTDLPALCVSVNNELNAGLVAGPKGLKLFMLKFT